MVIVPTLQMEKMEAGRVPMENWPEVSQPGNRQSRDSLVMVVSSGGLINVDNWLSRGKKKA